MSADLAAYTADDSSLQRLTRQSVIELLERGKSWIDLAVQRDTEVDDFVEFKGQAETVRVYTVQKQLGKDAELAAAELVRRAERGIGLAIRKGQENGEIRQHGDAGGPRRDYIRNGQLVRVGDRPAPDSLKSPESFGIRSDELARGPYALADGVSEEQFETAVAEAKAEGNLSRANVVRKVTGRPVPKGKRPEVLRGTRRIDSRRVIAATVDTYADNAIPPDLLAEVRFDELETHDLREWISSLSESARALRSLRTILEKELNQRG